MSGCRICIHWTPLPKADNLGVCALAHIQTMGAQTCPQWRQRRPASLKLPAPTRRIGAARAILVAKITAAAAGGCLAFLLWNHFHP